MRDAKWGMNELRKKEGRQTDTESKKKRKKEREMQRHRAALWLHGKSNKRQDHCPGGRRFIAPLRGGVEKRKNWNSHFKERRRVEEIIPLVAYRSFCLSAFQCALRSHPVCFLIGIHARGDAWGLQSQIFAWKNPKDKPKKTSVPGSDTRICHQPSHQDGVVCVILSQPLVLGINDTLEHV